MQRDAQYYALAGLEEKMRQRPGGPLVREAEWYLSERENKLKSDNDDGPVTRSWELELFSLPISYASFPMHTKRNTSANCT